MHSIRYKALLPMGLLALVLLALIVMAAGALSDSIGLSRSLASRYHDMERVRHIEVHVSELMAPLVSYLDTGSADSRTAVQRSLDEIRARVRELRGMTVVSAQDREFLEFVDGKLGKLQQLSDFYFSTSPSQHGTLVRTLGEITRDHLSELGDRLHQYHDLEISQVNELVRDAEHVQSSFRAAGFAAAGVTLGLFALAIWVNNRFLVQPILSISQSTSGFARGRLDQEIGVASRDELGQLARDISSMAKALQATSLHMKQLAHTDALTGLMNRRAFDQTIERELHASRRCPRGFGLVMVDVDHFKRINDRYGHAIGDEILRFVALTLTQALRSNDAAFRIGGEEFALLLQEVDHEATLATAERLRRLLAASPWTDGEHTVPVTASFGVACASHHGDSPDALMKAADAALYIAKSNGRNRVEGPAGGVATVPRQLEQPCVAN